MGGEAPMAIFPLYGDVSRLDGCDLTAIGWIAVETNASADFEESGLAAGHLVGCPKTPRREFNLSVW